MLLPQERLTPLGCCPVLHCSLPRRGTDLARASKIPMRAHTGLMYPRWAAFGAVTLHKTASPQPSRETRVSFPLSEVESESLCWAKFGLRGRNVLSYLWDPKMGYTAASCPQRSPDPDLPQGDCRHHSGSLLGSDEILC